MGRNCFQSMCNEWKKTFRAPESCFCSHQSEKNRKLRVHPDPWKKNFLEPEKVFFIVIQSVPCGGMPGCSRTSVFVLQWNHCLRTHCIKNLRGWIAGFNSVYQLIEIRTLGNPEILVNSSYSPFPGTPNCPSRGEIPKILKLAWGKAFVEVVAMRRLACV